MLVFGMFDNGGDLVETSFLMEGLLAARQYFKGDSEPSKYLSEDYPPLGNRGVGLVPADLTKITHCCGPGLRSRPVHDHRLLDSTKP